jgi:hypothetical protein
LTSKPEGGRPRLPGPSPSGKAYQNLHQEDVAHQESEKSTYQYRKTKKYKKSNPDVRASSWIEQREAAV